MREVLFRATGLTLKRAGSAGALAAALVGDMGNLPARLIGAAALPISYLTRVYHEWIGPVSEVGMTNYREERKAQRIATELLSRPSEELRERMRQAPEDPILWMTLVNALSREKRESEALFELGRVIEARGRGAPMARRWRAGLLTRLGRYAEAIIDLEQSVEAGDKQPANFYALGNLHQRLGDARSARAYWQLAIVTSRDHNKPPNRWSGYEWLVWFVSKTLLNIEYYARVRILWSYLFPRDRGRST